MPQAVDQTLKTLRENWVLITAFVVLVLAAGEVRWRVDALEKDKSVDAAQAVVLTQHEGRLIMLESFNATNFSNLEQDKRHWGAILEQWPKRLSQLDDHERRLVQIETLRGLPIGGQ